MNKKHIIFSILIFIAILLFLLNSNIAYSKEVFVNAGSIGIKGVIAEPAFINDN